MRHRWLSAFCPSGAKSVRFPGIHRRFLRPAHWIALSLLLASCQAAGSGIEEASGVVRRGDELIIVGDHVPGTYAIVPAADIAGGALPLEPKSLAFRRIAAGRYASDLEGVVLLADGRAAFLSEDLASLFDVDSVICTYGSSCAEIDGRGLEGIAARDLGGGRSRVAVLWEGGYVDGGDGPQVHRPVILTHDLEAEAKGLVMGADESQQRELVVPLPAGEEPWAQRFRAPDLVWHRLSNGADEEWGWIVLLSSEPGHTPAPRGSDACCPMEENGAPRRYCWKWLQRFRENGEPWGEPFDLDAVLPPELQTVNWEGMGWFEAGRSVVLVYDERYARRRVDPQVAFVVPLPPEWIAGR